MRCKMIARDVFIARSQYNVANCHLVSAENVDRLSLRDVVQD